IDRHNLVVVTLKNERRDTDCLQVFGLISLREGFDAVIMRFGTAGHALPPPVLDHGWGDFRIRPIEAVKGARGDVEVKLCSVSGEGSPPAVEDLYGIAAGVVLSLHHERCDT